MAKVTAWEKRGGVVIEAAATSLPAPLLTAPPSTSASVAPHLLLATTTAPSVARNKTAESAPTVARKQMSLPKAQGAKPARVKGYCWRANGSGWECRRTWTEAGGKRRQTYVAHLSREAFSQLRRKHHTPGNLAAALADWITEREHEKGNG